MGGLERGALAANLLHKDSLDDLGVRVGRRVDVGHHRDARLHDGGVGQRLLQLLGLPSSNTAPPQPPSDSPPTPSPYPGPASRRLAASGHLAAASGYVPSVPSGGRRRQRCGGEKLGSWGAHRGGHEVGVEGAGDLEAHGHARLELGLGNGVHRVAGLEDSHGAARSFPRLVAPLRDVLLSFLTLRSQRAGRREREGEAGPAPQCCPTPRSCRGTGSWPA